MASPCLLCGVGLLFLSRAKVRGAVPAHVEGLSDDEEEEEEEGDNGGLVSAGNSNENGIGNSIVGGGNGDGDSRSSSSSSDESCGGRSTCRPWGTLTAAALGLASSKGSGAAVSRALRCLLPFDVDSDELTEFKEAHCYIRAVAVAVGASPTAHARSSRRSRNSHSSRGSSGGGSRAVAALLFSPLALSAC